MKKVALILMMAALSLSQGGFIHAEDEGMSKPLPPEGGGGGETICKQPTSCSSTESCSKYTASKVYYGKTYCCTGVSISTGKKCVENK